MANLNSRDHGFFRTQGSSGQALLEYILLLSLVVIVALSTLYQFNGAFRNFLDGYFGDYIACLLETGALPSSGGGEARGGVCDSEYKPFNINSGRPLIVTGPNSPGSGGSGGANDGNVSSENGGAGNNEDLRPDSAAVNTANSGASSGGGSGSGSMFAGGRSDSSRKGRGGSGDGDEEGVYTGSDAVSSSGSGMGGVSGEGGYERRARLPGNFLLDEERDELEAGRPRRVSIKEGEENELRPPRVKVDETGEKKSTKASEDEPMTFGGFLRILLISAIIIALVLLLGGQFLQISKNMEGSD